VEEAKERQPKAIRKEKQPLPEVKELPMSHGDMRQTPQRLFFCYSTQEIGLQYEVNR